MVPRYPTENVTQLNPNDYLSTVNQAYANLGQSATDTPHPELGKDILGVDVGDRYNATAKFIQGLASAYVDRIHQATGQVPSEDQVRQFVAQNATQGNAMKFVQGQFNPDQMNTLADQFIQSNPGAQQGLPGQALINALQGYADQQYQSGRQQLEGDVQNQYIGQKRGLVEDLASQNQLGQANSRYSLNALEAAKNQELQRGINNLLGQRAQSGINIGLQGAQMGQQNQQFNQQLGLANRQFQNQQDLQAQNLGLQNRQLGLASELGRRQADANKPGWLDYLNTGANVAKAGVGIAGLFA